MVAEKIVGSTVLIRSIREAILPNGAGAVSRKLLEESCVGSSVMWLGAIHHAELLPHDHAKAAAPAFGKPHAHDFHLS